MVIVGDFRRRSLAGAKWPAWDGDGLVLDLLSAFAGGAIGVQDPRSSRG